MREELSGVRVPDLEQTEVWDYSEKPTLLRLMFVRQVSALVSFFRSFSLGFPVLLNILNVYNFIFFIL